MLYCTYLSNVGACWSLTFNSFSKFKFLFPYISLVLTSTCKSMVVRYIYINFNSHVNIKENFKKNFQWKYYCKIGDLSLDYFNTYCELIVTLISDILKHSTIVYLIISCYSCECSFYYANGFLWNLYICSHCSINYLSFNHFAP